MLRLAMSILVRDEADVIEDNIRFHKSMGVDHFIIMDNGSRDGTRDILEDLKDEFNLEILDEPSRSFDQDLWVTRMAFLVREAGRADCMIAADADEFWYSAKGDLKSDFQGAYSFPKKGSLKDTTYRPSVFLCPRFNMLPCKQDLEAPDYRFSDNIMKVSHPLGFHKNASDPAQKLDFEIMLRTMPSKVMCMLEGLRAVGMGNHSVEHEGSEPVVSATIQIYHYPVREFEQFEAKVVNQGEGLTSNERFDKGTGWHARRWYSLHKQGRLREEYESMILDDQQTKDLSRKGILEEDLTIKNYLQNLGDRVC